jgi:hypothetical protein
MSEANAQTRVEAWQFAADYLAHQTEIARLFGSEELLEVLERAEGRAWDERDRAAEQ